MEHGEEGRHARRRQQQRRPGDRRARGARCSRRSTPSASGPQAVGGTNTALQVNILTYPTHITALPVGVNIQCHSARLKEAVL